MRYRVKTWSTIRWENKGTNRYYEARIEQDLFGNFVVKRVWGGIGKSSGGANATPIHDKKEATAVVTSISERRKKRGYEQVSSQNPFRQQDT
ncbi:hypothetical protein A9Q81_11610 [Gammaproteobacteria bacterium 42_54_T18]|nr:hypothetical protein A9Q81_11610 [Gammaproteobacteria bacterium 42_54_T18]